MTRFLNGESVVARAAGAWYRMRKRIAKHKRMVAVTAAALVVFAVAVGWGIKTRSEAAERERRARRFTEMVERIEAMACYSAMSPAHDIRGDQAAIRARMDELDGEIRRADAIAVGPGHHALGRGYLALNDDAKAREHLESAWQHGFREPRAASRGLRMRRRWGTAISRICSPQSGSSRKSGLASSDGITVNLTRVPALAR